MTVNINMSSGADGGGSDHGLLQAEGDGLDAVHDALRASNAFVSAKTMERLSERVSRTNEAESLRVRALEEEVLSLAESLVSFREERQRVSTERSKDTQRLEEALSAVVETEVSAAKGAEAAVVGAVVGMQGSVNRRLIDETKERDEGYHALQMEANMMTSSLRDTVHAHAAAASSSAQQMRAHYATQARQLEVCMRKHLTANAYHCFVSE